MPLFTTSAMGGSGKTVKINCSLAKTVVRAMKLTAILLFTISLHVAANVQSQVTLSEKNTPLEKVLSIINKQTGFHFIYGEGILQEAGRITVHVKNVSLEEAIKACLKEKNLTYEIQDRVVIIKKKIILTDEINIHNPPIDVRGRVTNEKGEPIAGATITIKGTDKATSTDNNGNYILPGVDEKAVLVISGANIQQLEVSVNGRSELNATVKNAIDELDEQVVVAYGT